jgi:hypothetical protein
MLKEKSGYRATPFERAAGWVVTLGSIAVLAWVVLRSMRP